jgi:hypothetical protein
MPSRARSRSPVSSCFERNPARRKEGAKAEVSASIAAVDDLRKRIAAEAEIIVQETKSSRRPEPGLTFSARKESGRHHMAVNCQGRNCAGVLFIYVLLAWTPRCSPFLLTCCSRPGSHPPALRGAASANQWMCMNVQRPEAGAALPVDIDRCVGNLIGPAPPARCMLSFGTERLCTVDSNISSEICLSLEPHDQ